MTERTHKIWSVVSFSCVSCPLLERDQGSLILKMSCGDFSMFDIDTQLLVDEFIIKINISCIIPGGWVVNFSEARPINSRKAHRAWLTAWIECAFVKLEIVQSLTCSSDRIYLSMSCWVIILCDWVTANSNHFVILINNHCPERATTLLDVSASTLNGLIHKFLMNVELIFSFFGEIDGLFDISYFNWVSGGFYHF